MPLLSQQPLNPTILHGWLAIQYVQPMFGSNKSAGAGNRSQEKGVSLNQPSPVLNRHEKPAGGDAGSRKIDIVAPDYLIAIENLIRINS